MSNAKNKIYKNCIITDEWIGDAAVDFLVRRELVRRYPYLPVRFIEHRRRHLITNEALAKFAAQMGFNHGANKMERQFGYWLEHDFAMATSMMTEMADRCEHIKRIDQSELDKKGRLLKKVTEAERLRLAQRQAAVDLFEKADKETVVINLQ